MSQQQSSLAWEEEIADVECPETTLSAEPPLALVVPKEGSKPHALFQETEDLIFVKGSITVSF